MAGYKFWYISTPDTTTQYIWIIAETHAEAVKYFINNGYDNFYDYELESCDYLPESEWIHDHHSGQIYGGDAIL